MQQEEQTFYWENRQKRISLRINFHSTSHAINGVMTLGMRLRQATFNQWIQEHKTVEYVLEHLPEANFDPEFYEQHEPAIINKYNATFAGAALQLQAKRGLIQKIANHE